jgi:Protein of unknown function (DUF2459)
VSGLIGVRVVLLLLAISTSGACGAAESATLYVARRGWHIDLGLAVEDLSQPLAGIASHVPGTRYAFFGFGDRHYLLAGKHNAPVLLSALWPGAGIVLLTDLSNSPQEAFGDSNVIELQLDAQQMRVLQSFIWKSLRSHDGAVDVYREGPYDGSAYFLGSSKYSAFHTCNTWGAQALKAAGFHVRTAGVLFAHQLWSQARRLKREQDRKQKVE